MLLVIGVVLVQLAQNTTAPLPSGIQQSHWLGFSAALTACLLSGFAGVYFEKILKGSDVSVWMRNVQLSLLSIPFGLGTCFLYDGEIIRKQGFFFGYDLFIIFLVFLQAGGGLIVAMVVKFADNILKGFATSMAIIVSCLASIFLFGFDPSFQFVLGAFLVICSIFLYGHQPKTVSHDKHTFAEKVWYSRIRLRTTKSNAGRCRRAKHELGPSSKKYNQEWTGSSFNRRAMKVTWLSLSRSYCNDDKNIQDIFSIVIVDSSTRFPRSPVDYFKLATRQLAKELSIYIYIYN